MMKSSTYGTSLLFMAIGVVALMTGWSEESKLFLFIAGFSVGFSFCLLIDQVLGGWHDD